MDQKELAAFYVKACSAFSLKSFIVSVLLFRSLICLEFILCRLLGSSLISFSFSLLSKLHAVLQSGYSQFPFPEPVVGGFPFVHTLSSIYCLLSFCFWPFWPVWGDTSLKCWLFAFLSYSVMLTSFQVIFKKHTYSSWLLEWLPCFNIFPMTFPLGHFLRAGVF